jgi:hypothetical protein
VKTIVKKTINLETKRHDFDNEFAYLEVWSNAHLKDCFFAEKDFLYLDGSLKNGGKKYFFSKYTGEDVEKIIKPLNYENFTSFNKLYFYNEEGDIVRIDGVLASDTESEFLIKEEEEEEFNEEE